MHICGFVVIPDSYVSCLGTNRIAPLVSDLDTNSMPSDSLDLPAWAAALPSDFVAQLQHQSDRGRFRANREP